MVEKKPFHDMNRAPTSTVPVPSTVQIFNYQLVRLLGSGGMGNVYEATHVVLKKHVAIKILKSHLIETTSFMRFQQEAKTANKLKHPNIVSVYDFGISELGEPYMIMDLMKGQTLDHILKNGPLDVSHAIEIVHQILTALAFAHSQGVLHRDLKPSNIMIEKTPSGLLASVLDFGIAKLIDIEEAGLLKTRTGEIFGTPTYMSPEQAEGRKLDQRSDLYSIGCMLYEMLTGQPPAVGKTAMDILYKHVNEKPLSLTQASMGKKFPPSLERIVGRSLACEPGNRFASATEMIKSLNDFQAGRKVEFVNESESTAKSKRNVWSLIGAMTVALAAVATIAVMVKYSWNNEVRTTASQGSYTSAPTVSSVEAAIKSDADKADEVSTHKQLKDNPLSVKPRAGLELNGAATSINDDDIFKEQLKKSDQKLTRLAVIPNLIHDDSLKLLLNRKDLESINLSDCGYITDQGISYIVHLPKLRVLNLTRTNISDAAILDLNSVKNLEDLDLTGTKIHDKGLLALRHDLPLKRLLLKATGITDNGLEELHLCKTLRYLKLDECTQIENNGIAKISGMPLEQLDVVGTSITDGAINSLVKMPGLKVLGLSRTNITGKLLREIIIRNCTPNLIYIAVKGCKGITRENINYFRENRKKCNIRFLPNQITEKDLN